MELPELAAGRCGAPPPAAAPPDPEGPEAPDAPGSPSASLKRRERGKGYTRTVQNLRIHLEMFLITSTGNQSNISIFLPSEHFR